MAMANDTEGDPGERKPSPKNRGGGGGRGRVLRGADADVERKAPEGVFFLFRGAWRGCIWPDPKGLSCEAGVWDEEFGHGHGTLRGRRETLKYKSVKWVWVKIKPPGHGPQVWSRLLFTRIPFWVPMFDPQPYKRRLDFALAQGYMLVTMGIFNVILAVYALRQHIRPVWFFARAHQSMLGLL